MDFVNFGDCATQEERLQRAAELKAEAEKCGLVFSSYATGADFLNGSGGDTQAEIQRVKENVDIAAAWGPPVCATTSPRATRARRPAATRA